MEFIRSTQGVLWNPDAEMQVASEWPGTRSRSAREPCSVLDANWCTFSHFGFSLHICFTLPSHQTGYFWYFYVTGIQWLPKVSKFMFQLEAITWKDFLLLLLLPLPSFLTSVLLGKGLWLAQPRWPLNHSRRGQGGRMNTQLCQAGSYPCRWGRHFPNKRIYYSPSLARRLPSRCKVK